MAFTTLPTYSTGDTITAANWNTFVKDNFAAMPPGIFTATGELFAGEGADTGGLLSPSGVATEILIVDTTETLGMKYSSTLGQSGFTFSPYTNADYAGTTFGGTTVVIGVHDATGYNVPAGAAMLLARLDVVWNAGSTNDYISITNTTDTDMEMIRINSPITSTASARIQTGFVVPADGNIILEITDSSDVTLDLSFTGYLTT